MQYGRKVPDRVLYTARVNMRCGHEKKADAHWWSVVRGGGVGEGLKDSKGTDHFFFSLVENEVSVTNSKTSSISS